jgi:small subunit ribosomal protein S21
LTKIVRRDGESFASLLKRFRKKVARARILSTVRKERHFVSDAEKRQLARRKAVRRERRRQRRMQRRFGRA